MLLAGCTGGSTGDGSLERAVRSYSAAYLSGDGEAAHDLLSERCRERVPLDEFNPAVAAAPRLYGGAEMTSLTVDEQSGDLARVTYRYTIRDIDQEKEPWVRENGGWRNDDC